MYYWRDQIDEFREAIWRQVVFNSEGTRIIDLDFENFRVFSFLDCMPNRSSTPGAGPINNTGE